ncbi:MAG: hypothetical protein ACK4MF_03680 [Hyphomicrobiaceae bacterium]
MPRQASIEDCVAAIVRPEAVPDGFEQPAQSRRSPVCRLAMKACVPANFTARAIARATLRRISGGGWWNWKTLVTMSWQASRGAMVSAWVVRPVAGRQRPARRRI